MKAKLIYFPILLLLLASCEKSSSTILEVSQSSYDITYNETTLSIDTKANDSWTATSNASWCTLSSKSGKNDGTLIASVAGNINIERTATISIITTSGKTQKIAVTQSAMASGKEYHYKLPVIFHVLYKDKNDETQYVSQSRIVEILKKVNSYYQNASKSVDMNLEFYLATTDEKGNTLTTPGVEYVQWTEIPMDCNTFMTTNNISKNIALLWDPNKYINVMMYQFKQTDTNSVTLGISHMPYSVKGDHYLEGLTSIEYTTLEKDNLSYPYCLSINSKYINVQSTGNNYYSADVTVTLAHELGHYVGLHHAFSEDEDGNTNLCVNSDYCDDTPEYNRDAYEAELTVIQKGAEASGKMLYMEDLTLRENCKTGLKFTSQNIMDYSWSYANQFTADQRARVRNVLTYSPLIPGPKMASTTKTRSAEGPLDLPIVVRK